MLAPQTIGPFTHPLSRMMAKMTLKRSSAVFARDEVSVAHLKDIGVEADIGVASDVALRLRADEGAVPPHKTCHWDQRVGVVDVGGVLRGNQFGLNVDYPDMMRRMIEMFLAHPDQPDVHLVPHVISPDAPVEDDMAAAAALHLEFPATHLAPAFKTPSEAKGYIAQMSFFTGARMHACIAAFSSGVAVVPLAYSRKFLGLFGALGYDYVADCRSHQQQAIMDLVTLGYENRAELAAHAVAATRRGVERLGGYEQALSDLILDLTRAKEKPATRGAAGLAESA